MEHDIGNWQCIIVVAITSIFDKGYAFHFSSHDFVISCKVIFHNQIPTETTVFAARRD